MTRPSHFLNNTSLKGNATPQTQSLQDQLLETRLRIEQAKLAKLESDIPDPTPKYTRYEDMPPPTPEDEARFEAQFRELIAALDSEEIEQRLNRFRTPENIALRQQLKELGVL
ncbi:hypothetical protein GCM10011309_27460 [Litorimonas cladophorae]|uniref:Uncharacterized protein n=1 Tax=Litorimonas cladophorae TaxID=1220491 RepID=A0A918KW45_9PROT|nr:hypothetical protein [Litorimonas cladophorae]GGX75928.1 hypothetical protein GCM10011309_27460 [Litorimonas cladophorae]